MKVLKKAIIIFFYRIMKIFPVKKNTVLLFSYYGEQYSGSPKYIGKYLTEKTSLNVVWAFVNYRKHDEYSGNSVKYGHIKYYYYLATAGTIITNYRMTEEFRKRKNQVYIQTWHSSLRLKMIENDAVDTLPQNYVELAKNDSKQISYLLAGSKKSRNIFEQAFWYDGEIINCGTPQCDILFEDRDFITKKVFSHYNIPSGSHVALYAPTFRKNHNTSVYDLDADLLRNTLEKRFGGEWFILIRLHPHLINELNCFNYSDRILQATDYDDVQELLCASDVLISDYSAIMFDFSVTSRPCFLYTPDLKEYVSNDRKLYFDFNELPFENYENQNDLMNGIMSFSNDNYNAKITAFLSEIESYDDGKASERVYELIKKKVCEN